MGTAMGRREIPLHPLPMSYRTGGGGGPNPPDDDDDPSDPGDHESGPESEYYAPAESADSCIVVHYLFRRAGYPPALAAWRNGAWPRRLLYPDKVNLVEDALALPLWQGLSEDQFFQMLDNASATDRRFTVAQEEDLACIYGWYARVPTASNIADFPSRGVGHELLPECSRQAFDPAALKLEAS